MSERKNLNDEEISELLVESDECSDTSFDDDDFLPVDVHESLSEEEQSSDSDELPEDMTRHTTAAGNDCDLISKDGTKWQSEPLIAQTGRRRTENIISQRAGITYYAKSRVNNIRDAFLLFFPHHIVRLSLQHSNAFAQAKCGNDFYAIDENMFYAFIGVLILAGVYKSKNETTVDLFDVHKGRPIFTAIMSKRTFQYINRFIRFDDVMSRRQKKTDDKFAPIREFFEEWSKLLPSFFNPHECVTVDEQLLGFRGRCSFRQYMPSKPVKYGIKFWLLVCSKTFYTWKIIPYLGKANNTESRAVNLGEKVVLDLVSGLKGHNVTMDNFFSSYELGQKLLQKGITMVGTMRKNKRSIPTKLLQCKKMPLYTSTFAFTANTALVSYIGRKNKCSILQSTMHSSAEIEQNEKKLPSIIKYYNETKGGVDTVDKMVACYSCKRKTSRWPMAVFSNMVDISALNAFIIYKEVNPNWQLTQKTTMRRNFLIELGTALATPLMEARRNQPRSSSSASLLAQVKETSQTTSSVAKRVKTTPQQIKGRGRCHICYENNAANKNNVHETICCLCEKPCCKNQHNRNVCTKCFANKIN